MENSHLGRRQFLQHSAVGVAGVAATGSAWGADSIAPPGNQAAASLDVSTTVDVLVVGGGTAGTIAAIQAGRAGATTLILERNSQLGGTMTTGGVAFPVSLRFACRGKNARKLECGLLTRWSAS